MSAASAPTASIGSLFEQSGSSDRGSVVVLDREAIESSGQTSVAGLLRDLPFNTFGSPRPELAATGQAFAGLSLRGLGVGRTLILIDGRRLPVAPDTGEGQNLNAVALAAVERIEILSEGATAVYGGDAIGGVVNIITRKGFTGAEVMAGTSSSQRAGGATDEGSVMVGVAGDRGRVMAGAAYHSRDIVFARDRAWSRDRASVFSNNFFNANFTFLEHPEFGSANVPGCQGPGFSVSERGSETRCFYDFSRTLANDLATRNESLFTRASYTINNGLRIFAYADVSRVKSFSRNSPAPGFRPSVNGQTPINSGLIGLSPGSPNHPSTPPDQGGLNPNWTAYQGVAEEGLLLAHRFVAGGPRDTRTDAVDYRLDIGMQARVGRFDIDFGVRRAESNYVEIGRNNILLPLAQPQIDSGAYNIYESLAVPEELVRSFAATTSRDARTVQNEAYAQARSDLPFSTGAGPVGIAFGVEYIEQNYADRLDPLVVSGTILGPDRSPASIDHWSWSAFGEVRVPLADTLDLTGAVRHADHSLAGTATARHVALTWQPSDRFSIRAAGGRHFRAPSLAALGPAIARLAGFAVDVPGSAFPFPLSAPSFNVPNKKIDHEQAWEYRLGIHSEPFSWLSATLDLWDTELKDRVTLIPGQIVLNCVAGLEDRCPSGLSELSAMDRVPDPSLGLGVARDPVSGILRFVQTGFGNFGTIESRGADLRLSSRADIRSGRLKLDLLASYLHRYRLNGGDNQAGIGRLPEWRGRLGLHYRVGDLAFAWIVQHIAGQSTSLGFGSDEPLPSWTTHDIQANWETPWKGSITLGIDNLADKDPVLDPGELLGYNFDLYDGYGRIGYLRYRQAW